VGTFELMVVQVPFGGVDDIQILTGRFCTASPPRWPNAVGVWTSWKSTRRGTTSRHARPDIARPCIDTSGGLSEAMRKFDTSALDASPESPSRRFARDITDTADQR